MNYYIPKKNIIASILLTFLFGPIGLFYASITGGLVMTFAPIILAISYAASKDLVTTQSLFVDSFSFLFVYGLFAFIIYWPICILWSVISTVRYNNKLINEYNLKVTLSEKPSQEKNDIIDWLQQHPGKGINDYYSNKIK